METSKVFKGILLVLFIMFIALYLSANAGLIDYRAKHKTVMTEQAIKDFEEDLRNGKDIDTKKYLDKVYKNYDNCLSQTTLKVSNSIGEGVDSILKFFFRKIERAMTK